ncbi:hypothetical protein N7489_003602 [Penicillium chrysogenum]|uniref:uncharacterized protein n=1 Tax=Penicillium chrysogenum TaxID=5076 RepID=UPI0024DF1E59|nr:uncharacterized protein N7489_003602 [Penicillium chrysogenum]KAJ5253192.1 hypothetical protein N7489_003602 [Penicillium chrysogenum]
MAHSSPTPTPSRWETAPTAALIIPPLLHPAAPALNLRLANNAGGGSGWGDQGFIKGGTTDNKNAGFGHEAARKPASTIGNFLGLKEQKGRAENKYLQGVDLAANGIDTTTTSGGEPTCASEDHSFMERKPGGSDTLPGWKMAKRILDP